MSTENKATQRYQDPVHGLPGAALYTGTLGSCFVLGMTAVGGVCEKIHADDMVSRIAYFLTQSGAIVAILGTLAFAAGNVYEYYKEKRLYQLDMGFARGPRGKFTKIVSFKK